MACLRSERAVGPQESPTSKVTDRLSSSTPRSAYQVHTIAIPSAVPTAPTRTPRLSVHSPLVSRLKRAWDLHRSELCWATHV